MLLFRPLFKGFLKLGQKYKNIFVGFLVQMKTLKFALQINWALMVYNIYKFWNSTSWKLQNHNFFAIKVTKRPKHWNRLPKMIICLLPLMWLTWLTWPISTTATPRFFGYCHSNLSMSRKITNSKRIISYGNLIKGLSIN